MYWLFIHVDGFGHCKQDVFSLVLLLLFLLFVVVCFLFVCCVFAVVVVFVCLFVCLVLGVGIFHWFTAYQSYLFTLAQLIIWNRPSQ